MSVATLYLLISTWVSKSKLTHVQWFISLGSISSEKAVHRSKEGARAFHKYCCSIVTLSGDCIILFAGVWKHIWSESECAKLKYRRIKVSTILNCSFSVLTLLKSVLESESEEDKWKLNCVFLGYFFCSCEQF